MDLAVEGGMARSGFGVGLVAAVFALGCDVEPPPASPLFEGVVRVREIEALGDRILVANDVETALTAPPGSVPPERIHDLLVLSKHEGGLALEGVFDVPERPSRVFARRIAVDAAASRAYLALGDTSDTGLVQIVDLSDPVHPEARAMVDAGRTVTGLAAEGGLLATVGPGGLRLFDVSDADAPLPLGTFTPDDDAGLSDVILAGGRAWVVGTAGALPAIFLQPRLLIVDVADPEKPMLLGEYRSASPFQGLGVTSQLRGERAFLLGDLGLDVLDVSNASLPHSVGGIAASIRPLAGLYTDLAMAGDVALLATRAQGLEAVDVSFPPQPLPLTTYPDTSAPGSRAISVSSLGKNAFVALDRTGIRTLTVDDDGDGILTIVDLCPDDSDPLQEDVDFDGVGDTCDLCIEEWDPQQIDADEDGYGNRCDPDLDGNGVVNFADLALLRLAFFGTDPVADLDGDGVVNFADLVRMRQGFFRSPGPSARAPSP